MAAVMSEGHLTRTHTYTALLRQHRAQPFSPNAVTQGMERGLNTAEGRWRNMGLYLLTPLIPSPSLS